MAKELRIIRSQKCPVCKYEYKSIEVYNEGNILSKTSEPGDGTKFKDIYFDGTPLLICSNCGVVVSRDICEKIIFENFSENESQS